MTNYELRRVENRTMLNILGKITVIIYILLSMPFAAGALETALLKGAALDVRGNPVKGVEIFIYNSTDTRRPAEFISAGTDIEGRFSIALPLGKYWAVARLRGGEKYGPLMSDDRHSGEPMELEIDGPGEFEEEFTVMDIREAARLMKKTREDHFRIKGVIYDKKGEPVSNVYAFANRGMDMYAIPDYLSAWTDEDGQYTMYLPAGKYYVGYASAFPPDLQNKVLIEVKVEQPLAGFDLIADDRE